VTRDQANEHQAKQLADFLIDRGVHGVKMQGDAVTYPVHGGLAILQVKFAPLTSDQMTFVNLFSVVL